MRQSGPGHQQPDRTGTGLLAYHLMLICGLKHRLGPQNVRLICPELSGQLIYG